MTSPVFDPFNDRSSRDIRNELSKQLIASITTSQSQAQFNLTLFFDDQKLQTCHKTYIKDRLARYDKAVKEINTLPAKNTFTISAILWNLQLFFEYHEYLEHYWLHAVGDEKKLFQAMIRAAGVYVHLEQHRRASAEKMATKAVPRLKQSLKILDQWYQNAKDFIDHLEKLDRKPIRLVLHCVNSSTNSHNC